MKLEYRPFEGMRPSLDERALSKYEAIDALDCDLRFRTLKPFLNPDPSQLDDPTLTGLGYDTAGLEHGTDPVHHLHDILQYDPDIESIPEGMYEVAERGTCVAVSAVARDAHERVYFSRPAPSGGAYVRGRTDGEDDFDERSVGVPAPAGDDGFLNPQVDEKSTSNLSFDFKWYYYIEKVEGGEISEPGSLDSGNIVVTSIPDLFDDTTLRYTYNVPVTNSLHPFKGKDPTVDHFIMYGEMISEKGRFLGTVYPSPSVREGDTDAYVGGTLASGVMGLEDEDAPDSLYYCDVKFTPASEDYSYYTSYIFTYVTDRGEESAPSTPTDPLSILPSQKVTLTIVTSDHPEHAVAIRLYRTETTDAGTAFFFVEERDIVENSSIVIVDTALSVDLDGDTLQTVNWAPPPDKLKGLVFSTKGFYVGYVGSQLYLSEMYLAYAWPTDYAIDFTGNIRHVARYGDTIAVFTDREIALIVGNNPLEVRKIKVEGFELITSIFSSVEMDGLLYFSTASGIAAVSGTNVAMVSEDLISEPWWRTNVDTANVRITAFDAALYILAAPDGQVYRLGLQTDGGGLIRLSDENVRDLHTSSFYLGTMVLKMSDEDYYVIQRGSGSRRIKWRSRVEVSDVPMAVTSARILGDDYANTILRIYEGDEVDATLQIQIPNDKVRKLPVMRRGREWSFEVESDGNVVSMELGTSGRVR